MSQPTPNVTNWKIVLAMFYIKSHSSLGRIWPSAFPSGEPTFGRRVKAATWLSLGTLIGRAGKAAPFSLRFKASSTLITKCQPGGQENLFASAACLLGWCHGQSPSDDMAVDRQGIERP